MTHNLKKLPSQIIDDIHFADIHFANARFAYY